MHVCRLPGRRARRELAGENATLKAELQALRSAVAQHLAAQAQTLQCAQAAMAAQVRACMLPPSPSRGCPYQGAGACSAGRAGADAAGCACSGVEGLLLCVP